MRSISREIELSSENGHFMKHLALLTLVFACTPFAFADDVVRERPAAWKNLVHGGQFKDLFLPMPVRPAFTSETWGGNNVLPRDISNGIEELVTVVLESDGLPSESLTSKIELPRRR